MGVEDRWIPIKERLPEPGQDVLVAWTDELMHGHYERAHVMRRKNGDLVWRYTFVGSVEPTHWYPYPQIHLPALPTEQCCQRNEQETNQSQG